MKVGKLTAYVIQYCCAILLAQISVTTSEGDQYLVVLVHGLPPSID